MKLNNLFADELDEGIGKWLGTAGLIGAAALGTPKSIAPDQYHPAMGPKTPTVSVDPGDKMPTLSKDAMNKPPTTVEPKAPEPSPSLPKTSTSSNANPEHEAYLKSQALAAGISGDELAAFLAQTAHETMGFKSLYEFGNKDYFTKKYDIKHNPAKAELLGNVDPGDGVRYRGRGYIHLTGRFNYNRVGRALNLPLERKPHLAADPAVAAKIAIWFWKNKVRPNVDNWNDVSASTKPINAGLQGLADREANYLDYKAKLQPVKK